MHEAGHAAHRCQHSRDVSTRERALCDTRALHLHASTKALCKHAWTQTYAAPSALFSPPPWTLTS
eukprot:3090077-Rhodomonas_salina.1